MERDNRATIPFPLVREDAIAFRHPFTCVLVGVSMAGKSQWLLELIKHRREMIHLNVERVVYSYKRYQRAFDEALKDGSVEFVLENAYDVDPKQKTLLILDDQMLNNSIPLGHLFTVSCHHDNLSIIYVTHTLFHNDAQFRLASLNTNYFVIFKSVRGSGQINFLAHQLFLRDKEKARKLVRAYTHATKKPFTYLLIDLIPLFHWWATLCDAVR